MGLLTFSINLTRDGCVDHREGIADDETHAFFTRLLDEGEAMLWGRVTYEMMESYWPARPDLSATARWRCTTGARADTSLPSSRCGILARPNRYEAA